MLELRCGWVGVVSVLQAEGSLGACDYSVECLITTSVVLFLVRCVLEFRCGWVGVVSMLQAEFDVAGLEWQPCCRLKHKSCASACNTDTTPT